MRAGSRLATTTILRPTSWSGWRKAAMPATSWRRSLPRSTCRRSRRSAPSTSSATRRSAWRNVARSMVAGRSAAALGGGGWLGCSLTVLPLTRGGRGRVPVLPCGPRIGQHPRLGRTAGDAPLRYAVVAGPGPPGGGRAGPSAGAAAPARRDLAMRASPLGLAIIQVAVEQVVRVDAPHVQERLGVGDLLGVEVGIGAARLAQPALGVAGAGVVAGQRRGHAAAELPQRLPEIVGAQLDAKGRAEQVVVVERADAEGAGDR